MSMAIPYANACYAYDNLVHSAFSGSGILALWVCHCTEQVKLNKIFD